MGKERDDEIKMPLDLEVQYVLSILVGSKSKH